MVKICSLNYPKENEDKYNYYYNNYTYELHDFQKWTIEGIVTCNHVLICAPTGSGKSFGAEFAIDYFTSINKKVIYTSPIKSLSNQKFNDFTQKYPNVKVGIITGDISCNPDADVIIMTTEILLNKLYQINSKNSTIQTSLSFEMDIQNDLGCVIFDEIHMINDETRGHVWENSIMLLPRHIQMVGLSATLDNPEKFALWLETCGTEEKKLEVFLTRKNIRAVPLIHYSFITAHQGVFKTIKDKALQQEIKSAVDNPIVLQDAKGKFNDDTFSKINKVLNLYDKNQIYIKRAHALNQVTKYLTENEMTPAICYVFSIRQLEICAKEITTNLQEFDTKVPYIARRECDKILRDKFSNYEEYLHLPEYLNLVSLLEKGIAIHHSKMLPIFKEIVEIFFDRGYIKLLFATESVAIGLNLPVKTCIFTDIHKHDGTNLRVLQAHEYTQAAGRAGRLGLDNVGHVIHLNNIFRETSSIEYKTMMNGKPQTLISKFKISYNLLLNLIDIGNPNIVDFAKKSMTTDTIQGQIKELQEIIIKLNNELKQIQSYIPNLKTPSEIIDEYDNLQRNVKFAVNKKRKDMERRIQNIKDEYKFVEQELTSYLKIKKLDDEINTKERELNELDSYFNTNTNIVLNLLEKDEYINEEKQLTELGKIASQIRELHCLVFSKLYQDKILDSLEPKQLIALFSCFTNVKVQDEIKDNNPKSSDETINKLVGYVEELYNKNKDKELTNNINTGIDYNIHYDLISYVERWIDCENVNDCKLILQDLEEQKEIFLGEFVKAILKINNISCEFEKIAELTNNIAFLHKLKQIPKLTLKFVVTNQSLYV